MRHRYDHPQPVEAGLAQCGQREKPHHAKDLALEDEWLTGKSANSFCTCPFGSRDPFGFILNITHGDTVSAGRDAPDFANSDRHTAELPVDSLTAPIQVGFSDFDNDRDVDLFVADANEVRFFSNQRDGTFAAVGSDGGLGATAGGGPMQIADLNKDAIKTIVADATKLATS